VSKSGVIDKFHVMQYVYNAVEEVRFRIRKELKKQLSPGKKKTGEDKRILFNMEQLTHCHHRLSQSPDKWSEAGKELVHQLFAKYPQLKDAYEPSQKFKQWYNISHANELRMFIERNLQNRYYAVEDAKIKEFERQ
jgi:transposase